MRMFLERYIRPVRFRRFWLGTGKSAPVQINLVRTSEAFFFFFFFFFFREALPNEARKNTLRVHLGKRLRNRMGQDADGIQ